MKKLNWNRWRFKQPRRSDDSRSVDDVAREISNELKRLLQSDLAESPEFWKHAGLRLHDKLAEITDLAAGKLVFSSTETWRTVYQQVLESADVKRYLSVALIRSDDYWRDAPGESSLKFNYSWSIMAFTFIAYSSSTNSSGREHPRLPPNSCSTGSWTNTSVVLKSVYFASQISTKSPPWCATSVSTARVPSANNKRTSREGRFDSSYASRQTLCSRPNSAGSS